MLSLTGKLLIDDHEMKLSNASIVTFLEPGFSEAVITVPGKSPEYFKEGQTVELFLGYERYGLNNEFSGMIESVSPKEPVELRCCDYFYDLRRKRINRTFKNTSIEEILHQAAPGFEIVVDDEAKTLRVNTTCYARTSRWLIMKLAADYGFLAFFREKKLYFVKQEFLEALTDEAVYEEGVNIFEDTLFYHTSQKVGKVTVYTETKNGYIAKASYGTGSGEKTYTIDGLSNGESCYDRAKEIHAELNYEGFKGEFKTLGYPYIRPGVYPTILSDIPGKSGVYRCDKTVTDFGSNGFKRTVTIGIKHKRRVPVRRRLWN